ncbi:UNVERIFIED_ORG: hypothetical protein J2740_004161 [Rhizobium nepotum]|nr:hypothetical protein [Rhizobium nepotum]
MDRPLHAIRAPRGHTASNSFAVSKALNARRPPGWEGFVVDSLEDIGCGGTQLPIPTFVGGSDLARLKERYHHAFWQIHADYSTIPVTKTAKTCLQAPSLADQRTIACTIRTAKLEREKGRKQPFAAHHMNFWFGAGDRQAVFVAAPTITDIRPRDMSVGLPTDRPILSI